MPGLPKESDETIEETISATLSVEPSFVRIYPTIVLRNTALETWFKAGSFKPLTLQKALEVSLKMHEAFTAEGILVIKTGLHSDLNSEDIIAGPFHKNFGELVKAGILKNKILKDFNPLKILVISRKDISLFTGNNRELIGELKKKLRTDRLKFRLDKNLKPGEVRFEKADTYKVW
jgi:histone acetyltransferase (RNA polymerase elongator complex component)